MINPSTTSTEFITAGNLPSPSGSGSIQTNEEEIEKCNIIKNNYKCDIIINENKPYTLYNAGDIGNILGFSNIRSNIRTFDDSERIKFSKKTNGGNQTATYITYDGLIKILLKSRKPKSIDMSNLIGLNRKTQYYVWSEPEPLGVGERVNSAVPEGNEGVSIETDIIKCILTTFDGNKMKTQYNIGDYYIDLYFPDYLLAIECDELHHNNCKNKIQDDIRALCINKTLGCRFIRFNPYEKSFNLFVLLNDIHKHLFEYKKI